MEDHNEKDKLCALMQYYFEYIEYEYLSYKNIIEKSPGELQNLYEIIELTDPTYISYYFLNTVLLIIKSCAIVVYEDFYVDYLCLNVRFHKILDYIEKLIYKYDSKLLVGSNLEKFHQKITKFFSPFARLT